MRVRVLGAAIVGLLLLAPFWLGPYHIYLLSLFCIYAIVTLGLNILTGLTGQISLGHVGFFGIGAYTAALLAAKLGVPFLLGIPIAGLLAAFIGFLLGLPALRVCGHYLAMVTLAFGEIIQQVLIQWKDVTNGIDGVHVPAPVLLGLVLSQDRGVYYLNLAIMLLLLAAAANLTRGATGRAFKALRSGELAAQAAGIDLQRYKVLAFTISAFYTGVAGALFGALVGFISAEYFGFFQSILYLMMIVLGGLGSLLGAIIGAAIFTVLPELLRRFEQMQELVYGVLLLMAVVFMPRGIAGFLQRIWAAMPARFR